MNIFKDTFCGRCGGRGMKRETRKATWINRKDVIYSCLNPNCDRAESICVEFIGETGTKKLSDRNSRLYGYSDLGNIETISKKAIDTMYEKEE